MFTDWKIRTRKKERRKEAGVKKRFVDGVGEKHQGDDDDGGRGQ